MKIICIIIVFVFITFINFHFKMILIEYKKNNKDIIYLIL